MTTYHDDGFNERITDLTIRLIYVKPQPYHVDPHEWIAAKLLLAQNLEDNEIQEELYENVYLTHPVR